MSEHDPLDPYDMTPREHVKWAAIWAAFLLVAVLLLTAATTRPPPETPRRAAGLAEAPTE